MRILPALIAAMAVTAFTYALPHLVQPPATPYYYPETIDTLLAFKSAHSRIEVRGTVGAMTKGRDETIVFRLVDEHNHSIACVLPPDHPQPRFGVAIVVSGVRNQFTVPTILESGRGPDRTVVEIDPVEAIREP